MSELELLHHIYRRSSDLTETSRRVIIGPGDDCALISTVGRSLLKVDQLIEGTHFAKGTPVDLVARKAMARPVSDIAAMGGKPVASLCACCLPAAMTSSQANELFDAVSRWARHFEAPLVGGDIATARGGDALLILTITVVGDALRARPPVLRSDAKVGDWVYVTGAGLGGSLGSDSMGRHLTFVPRVGEAMELARVLGMHLHAMIDLSDGLGIDAGRIALASGVAIELEEGRIPIHASVRDERGGSGKTAIERALGDGEDYELLFTASAEAPVPARCTEVMTPVVRIGRVVAGTPGSVVLVGTDGSRMEVGRAGWDGGRAKG